MSNRISAILLTLFLFSSVYAEIPTLSNKIYTIPSEQLTFKNTIAYTNGKPYTGRVIEYKDDKKFLEYGYKNGIQEGLETGWNTKTGTKQHESHWILGKKEGLYITYRPNGKKSSSVNYINDVKEGLKTVWHENGQIDYQQNYSGGTRLGSQFTPTLSKSVKKSLSTSKLSAKKNSTQSSAIKFKKLSKQDIFKAFSGKTVVFNTALKGYKNKTKYPICIKFSKDSTKALEAGKYKSYNSEIVNCNPIHVKDIWIEYMGGKLCVETSDFSKACKRIREFSNKKYKFGFSSISIHEKLNPTFETKKLAIEKTFEKTFEKKSNTGTVYTHIDPNSIKIEIHRDGGLAEETETIFKTKLAPSKYNWSDPHLATYKALLLNPPPVSELPRNIFAIHPYLEREYEPKWRSALALCRSQDEVKIQECKSQLRKLAKTGMIEAYISLIFDQDSLDQLQESNPFVFQSPIFRNLFGSFTNPTEIKIPELTSIAVAKNPNNNPDQAQLFKNLIILSQKKFQHYNWLIARGGDEILPLGYKIFSETGQADAIAQYQLITRVPEKSLKPIRKYLSSDIKVIQDIEKLANSGDLVSIFTLLNTYHESPLSENYQYQIIRKSTKKAEFYAKLALKFTPKNEVSMRKQAYKILEDLGIEDYKTEVQLYRGLEEAAKNMSEKETYEQGKYCTVELFEKNQKKRTVYRYTLTERCLKKIEEADKKFNLNQGRFKNGNNPLIFWGPQGSYKGTLELMEMFKHKPLNK